MPTRYLKPGVRDSEAIDSLSPLAENLFYRLLVTVDDFGRFDSRPAMIKASCFPIKESVSINKCKDLIDELARSGLVSVYQAEGKNVLQMSKWDNVPRQKESKYPAMSDACIQVHTDVYGLHTNAPLTKTETETETETKTKTVAPEGVSIDIWNDFVSLRKSKKAAITSTALLGLQREAKKANMTLEQVMTTCCERGWAGFKAEWMVGQAIRINKQDMIRQTVPTPVGSDSALKKIEEDRKLAVPPPENIKQRINEILKRGI